MSKKQTTNKMLLTFEDPKLLTDFNEHIKKKYGTVRGYRIQVIEKLIRNYLTTETITENKNTYIENIEHQQKKIKELTESNKNLGSEIKKLSSSNENKNKIIEELEKQLKQLENIKKENIELSKKNIELTEKHKNDTNNIYVLTENKKELQKQVNKYDTDYKQLVQTYQNEIKELNNKKDVLMIRINNLVTENNNIKQLNLIDRIFKRYPKEIIELEKIE